MIIHFRQPLEQDNLIHLICLCVNNSTWIWQKSLKQSKPIFFYDELAKTSFVVAGVVRRNSGVTGTLNDLVSHFQFWIFVTFLKEII